MLPPLMGWIILVWIWMERISKKRNEIRRNVGWRGSSLSAAGRNDPLENDGGLKGNGGMDWIVREEYLPLTLTPIPIINKIHSIPIHLFIDKS